MGSDVKGLMDFVEDSIRSRKDCFRGLYPHQREAILSILGEFLSRGYVKGVVQMPTGTGKTVLAAALVLALWRHYSVNVSGEGVRKDRLLALFLAPRTVIRSQAYRTFLNIVCGCSKKCVEVREAKNSQDFCSKACGFINPPRLDDELRDIQELIRQELLLRESRYPASNRREPVVCGVRGLVVIVTPHLLHKIYRERRECFNQIINNADILLMDEVHTFYIGEKIIKTINYILNKGKIPVIIGLTATPVRDCVKLLGKVIYSKLSKDAMREGILVPGLKVIGYKTYVSALKPLSTKIRIREDDEWKYAIKERAEKYVEKIIDELTRIKEREGLNRLPKTLIIAANTKEADFIHRELRRRLPEIEIHKAHYKVDSNDPHDIIEDFKRRDTGILVTVNMADIGFDDPNLEVLVLARPITSPVAYTQLRGRVLRKPRNLNNLKELRKYAVIIDLVGRKNIKQLEESVSKVEKALFAKDEISNANKELRGIKEVPLASADIDVKNREELNINYGEGELSKSPQLPEEEDSILLRLKEYNINYSVTSLQRYIIIRRSARHTVNEWLIDGRYFKDLKHAREQVKNAIHTYIKNNLRVIEQDAEELKEKDNAFSLTSKDNIIEKIIEAMTNKVLDEVNSSCLNTKKSCAEADNPRNYCKYVETVINSGECVFEYEGHRIKLLKTLINGRHYIKIYIDGLEKGLVRTASIRKTAKKVFNVLRNHT